MIKLLVQSPKKALKAFLKQKPLRSEIDVFKTNLIALLDKISIIEKRPKDESEEHLKNDLRDFLRDTYYRDTNAINTKDKKDLVIHISKTTDSEVGVIIEAKRPTNVNEMVSANSPNKKALHELILYYLDERNKIGNNQLKQLVLTNVNEWFIIDANYFDKHIYRNTQIKKLYETKINDKKDNPFFYEEIAKIVSKLDIEIPCVYFDIRDYDTILRNNKKDDDKELIALFKILSPQHLLKIASSNDSNSLNEKFYKELLHIIGLEEAKENGKNIIRRKKEGRNPASLIEATIEALDTEDVLHRLPDQSIYGENKEERIFNVSLELCITWINRILFLKLLEGQLITYHQGNKEYRFLNTETINDFDELFKLFHKVLAVNLNERNEAIKNKYSRVPYLNSSLFEISELEDQTIKINSLDNSGQLELIGTTILKDIKKKVASLPTLNYLFQFLDAYDFASEGAEDVQEDNKTIINASVLGKVFEKINGYKDGSIYTPAFITMYMCRQSIRLAVVEKFNEVKKWNINHFDELYNKIDDKKEANELINTLKICDPAVGSGHFLVSALNEIIAIKSELGVLMDEKNKTLRDYEIEIVNDELIITDENGNIVAYNPKNSESTRVQKTLFQEKQTIIENCLFGVDINPNSIKICRLRLWIELLKNAYYKSSLTGNETEELETLPNIDINIKCGNSLISRFNIDADLKPALLKSKWNISTYRNAVFTYKNATSKDSKRELLNLINDIKSSFVIGISREDKKVKELNKKKNELFLLTTKDKLFDLVLVKGGKKLEKEKIEKITKEINNLETAIEEQKSNKIYKNAFEWRFEFPEVLSNDGEFEGFDLIIGNPPYMIVFDGKTKELFEHTYPEFKRNNDLYVAFIKMGFSLLKPNAYFSFITPNTFVRGDYFKSIRNYLANEKQISEIIDFGNVIIFEGVNVFCAITTAINKKPIDQWLLKTELDTPKGFIEPNTSDFILKNKVISRLDKLPKFESCFLIKDVGFNYWSEGRGKIRGNSIGSRVFYNGVKENISDIPYIKGGDIQKYTISFSNNFLRYNWNSFLEKNDTFRFSQEMMERSPKIIYRQTSNKIIAALDFNKNFNDKTVHIIVNKDNFDFDLKAVLAILNSKMMNYFFQSFKEEEGRAFAQVKTVDIKNLPFNIPSKKQQKELSEVVDKILEAKQQNKDSTAYESTIDELVYKLYNITPEEQKIIEG